MPVYTVWDNNEHTTVRLNFIGQWTWEECYAAADLGYQMVDSVAHVVDTLIDMSQSAGLPLLAMTHARNMIARRHPRSGRTVFVGANPLFVKLWKVFLSAYRYFSDIETFAFAETAEEARAIFAAQRPSRDNTA